MARYAMTDGSGVAARFAAMSELLILAVGANGFPRIQRGSGALDIKRVRLPVRSRLGRDFLALDWFQVFHGCLTSLRFGFSVLHTVIIACVARSVKLEKPAMSCKLCRMNALRG